MVLSVSCSSDDDNTDFEPQPPYTFILDPLTQITYDVTASEPAHANYLLGIFPFDPDAVRYELRFYDSSAPNLHFEVSWNAFDPVPSEVALSPLVPGYNDGRIGDNFYVKAVGNGCNYSVNPNNTGCYPGSGSLANLQQALVAIGGKMEVTIYYE
ncbi:hypothetical protein BWZ20_13585 [Winogradskyella sp. J14-2]|nr:hypothetical protein BWZ20_13585 [Winogradskyella sp. J14-2]